MRKGAHQCKECQIIAIAERLRRIVLTAISGSEIGPETKPPADNYVTTYLQPKVFLAWAHATGDPDGVVADWLTLGAPCGIASLPEHKGIFSVCDDPCETNIEDMIHCGPYHSTQHAKHTAEEEQLMYNEVSTMKAKGFVRSFASPKEVTDFVGGEFVESNCSSSRRRPRGSLSTVFFWIASSPRCQHLRRKRSVCCSLVRRMSSTTPCSWPRTTTIGPRARR